MKQVNVVELRDERRKMNTISFSLHSAILYFFSLNFIVFSLENYFVGSFNAISHNSTLKRTTLHM